VRQPNVFGRDSLAARGVATVGSRNSQIIRRRLDYRRATRCDDDDRQNQLTYCKFQVSSVVRSVSGWRSEISLIVASESSRSSADAPSADSANVHLAARSQRRHHRRADLVVIHGGVVLRSRDRRHARALSGCVLARRADCTRRRAPARRRQPYVNAGRCRSTRETSTPSPRGVTPASGWPQVGNGWQR
jgi:hypothetical protein